MGVRLDTNEPYATFSGVPGVAFAQDGKLFDLAGEQVTYHRVMVDDEGTQVERTIVERVVTMHSVVPEPAANSGPFFKRPVAEEPRRDMRADNSGDNHWMALKAKLAMFDEPYTTKEATLAFLAGKGQA